MPDNIKKRGVQDNIKVNASESLELKDWAKKFGVSTTAIILAVKEAGPLVKNVREWLHNNRYIKATD